LLGFEEFDFVFDEFFATHPKLSIEEFLEASFPATTPPKRQPVVIFDSDEHDEIFDVHPLVEAIWNYERKRYVPIPKFREKKRKRIARITITEVTEDLMETHRVVHERLTIDLPDSDAEK